MGGGEGEKTGGVRKVLYVFLSNFRRRLSRIKRRGGGELCVFVSSLSPHHSGEYCSPFDRWDSVP